MPTICIEGADRVGKSTLISAMVGEMKPDHVIHFPTKEPPSYSDAMWFIKDFWAHRHDMYRSYKAGGLTILDRCWPSALVYQKKPDLVELMKIFFPIDHYILMTIPHDAIFERMDSHSEEVLEAVEHTWSDTDAKYKSLMKWDLILDGTDDPLDNISLIKELIND